MIMEEFDDLFDDNLEPSDDIIDDQIIKSNDNDDFFESSSKNKTSSVIILDSIDIPKDYTTSVKYTIEDPANVIGQQLYIKLITECKVRIESVNSSIEGEDHIELTRKYQAVTLYSTGSEWLIL